MPTKERLEKAKARSHNPSPEDDWECPWCHKAYSRYKGGPSKHERTCPERPELAAPVAKQTPKASIPAKPAISDDSGTSTSAEDSSLDEVQAPAHHTTKRHKNVPVGSIPSPPPPQPDMDDNTAVLADMPATLGETEVWVKRHPSSGIPSGYLTELAPNTQPTKTNQLGSTLPLFFPLRTHTDFLQAEIFSRNNCSDGHINEQLKMLHQTGAYTNLPASERLTLKDAADYHATLHKACGASDQFTIEPFITEFKGHRFTHELNFRPIYPVLEEIVGDEELFKEFTMHPEQVFIRRSEEDPTPMRVWEQIHQGDDWWNMQDSIPSDHHILHLVIYIDETNVSTIGGVEVWPVYVWIGNLSAATRKQRKKKGGAVLLGYLPEASSGDIPLSDADLAELRTWVYHDALALMFESLRIPARHGTPMRCGDGKIRMFHPTIGAISVDYKEL
ncbi:hypothetical protein FRC08_009290 [Ceratobasidium sp. 394]|nr:hypothetical protein FRC08_009290 [Ceratobasidium sp. 394]